MESSLDSLCDYLFVSHWGCYSVGLYSFRMSVPHFVSTGDGMKLVRTARVRDLQQVAATSIANILILDLSFPAEFGIPETVD